MLMSPFRILSNETKDRVYYGLSTLMRAEASHLGTHEGNLPLKYYMEYAPSTPCVPYPNGGDR